MSQFIKKPSGAARASNGNKQEPMWSFAADEIPTVEQPAVPGPIYPNQPVYPNQSVYPNQPVPPLPPGPQRPLYAQHKQPNKRVPRWARILLVILVILLVAGGSAFAYYEFNYASTINDITGQAAIRKGTVPQVDPLTQRTNILLLGSDTDGKGNDPNMGQPLAQTVIIITIDPKTNYVGMLSIPRDMQISDPAYSYVPPGGKIDEVFQSAWQGNDASTKARAAAGHIMDVIQNNYGIRIDHYAWVGLQGFIKVINELGGIDIDVTHPITDDDYPDDTSTTSGGNVYGYQRLYLPPGPQHLDGQTTLEYVRTRHADLGGDFGRTERQQQVLSQMKEEITQSRAIAKAPQILKDLDGYLMTDMTLNQLASFAQIAQNVDINKIDKVSFTPPNYAQQITDGRGNFAPICSAIEPKIQQMFATQPNCIPQAQASSIQSTSTGIAQATTHAQATYPTSTAKQALSTERPINTADMSNVLKLLLFATSGSLSAMQ